MSGDCSEDAVNLVQRVTDKCVLKTSPRLDLTVPRWDQSTLSGRFKHFLNITDARLSLYSREQFEEAKDLVTNYKSGTEPPGTTEDQLWHAQKLYMSAYHPDTGERQNIIGRMSFQVPACIVIASASLHFYKSLPAVAFLQWVNQSFNALVNYTNRNATSPISNRQIGVAYVSATGGALLAAFGFTLAIKKSPGYIRRFVPFVAVSASHCVNIPMMRQQEIMHGVQIYNEQGQQIGTSKKAAYKSISQVVTSRIIMVVPSLCGVPVIMEMLLKYRWFRRARWLHVPFQAATVGTLLCFMVPFSCAIFPQRASLTTDRLEPTLRDQIRAQYGDAIQKVYFNKGL